MDAKQIKLFLELFPPHLEPILIVNDRSTYGDDSRFHTELYAPVRLKQERINTIMEIVGFLFCPDHDDEPTFTAQPDFNMIDIDAYLKDILRKDEE